MSAPAGDAEGSHLGVDVGGTGVKAALVGANGAVLASRTAPTPAEPDALTATVIALCSALRAPDTMAVGVASPGVVADGVVRFAANVAWRDEPVRDRVSGALGLPVVLGRDVAAAATAECQDHPDASFVAIGTGIAGAHVSSGVVRAGATSLAGEIGHIPVYPDGEPCGCGQYGCPETYASAAAITRRYEQRAGVRIGAADIVARTETDQRASAVWQQAIDALALALVTDVLITDPGVIVIGGGLAAAGAPLFDPLRAQLAARLAWRPAPPVLAGRFGPLAGAIGAARWAAAVPATPDHPDTVLERT